MNTLPDDGLALAALEEQVLQPGVKGLPITEPLRQHMIGAQDWNVLNADTSFPVAVLKQSALLHNLQWMREFCEHYGVQLAPHGKTTMSPQLFGAQLANGAWGLTLATAAQVQIAARFGVRRIILANELVAPADIIQRWPVNKCGSSGERSATSGVGAKRAPSPVSGSGTIRTSRTSLTSDEVTSTSTSAMPGTACGGLTVTNAR